MHDERCPPYIKEITFASLRRWRIGCACYIGEEELSLFRIEGSDVNAAGRSRPGSNVKDEPPAVG
jgi:hypothetical protein